MATRIRAVTYLPRQDRENGRAAEYDLQISADGDAWETLSAGRLEDTGDLETFPLPEPRPVRFVRWTVKSEVRGRNYGSVAELSVVPAAP